MKHSDISKIGSYRSVIQLAKWYFLNRRYAFGCEANKGLRRAPANQVPFKVDAYGECVLICESFEIYQMTITVQRLEQLSKL